MSYWRPVAECLSLRIICFQLNDLLESLSQKHYNFLFPGHECGWPGLFPAWSSRKAFPLNIFAIIFMVYMRRSVWSCWCQGPVRACFTSSDVCVNRFYHCDLYTYDNCLENVHRNQSRLYARIVPSRYFLTIKLRSWILRFLDNLEIATMGSPMTHSKTWGGLLKGSTRSRIVARPADLPNIVVFKHTKLSLFHVETHFLLLCRILHGSSESLYSLGQIFANPYRQGLSFVLVSHFLFSIDLTYSLFDNNWHERHVERRQIFDLH